MATLADRARPRFPGDGLVTRARYRGRNLRYRALLDAVRRHAAGDVLDVGGGAFVTDAVAAGAEFGSWTVVEPCAADLPAAADPRVRGHVADGCALDLPDAAYDAVLSIQVLEHVFEPIRMLSELHRVARPGAPIVVMVPQTANAHHLPRHFQNFTRYWLEEAAERLGAEVVEYRALGGAWSSLASRLVLQYPGMLRVAGYAHPGVHRGWLFWALFPLGLLVSALVVPLSLLLATADMEEEANNHLIVLRRAAVPAASVPAPPVPAPHRGATA